MKSNNECILKSIESVAINDPGRTAIVTEFLDMTYGQLWNYSEKLAHWIKQNVDNTSPIMVYGHKNPYTLVCFLACAKSGHAYCPVDISIPKDRIEKIAKIIDNYIILSTEHLELDGYDVISIESIKDICNRTYNVSIDESWHVQGNDTFYIIFTSGSTGTPKGVEISEFNLTNFLHWAKNLSMPYLKKDNNIFLNQAPFSFDLSVFDTYLSLTSGGTLVCLDKNLIANMANLFEFLNKSGPECWVSTPSFVDMCMADKKFSSILLPNIKLFLFCGEALTKSTVYNLKERFQDASIVNTYGPTESTVAVTSIEITDEVMNMEGPLPIGIPKPGTDIQIENGEIIIIGDTVAKGYFKDPEKTSICFVDVSNANNQTIRKYKTGDKGYFKNGTLYCDGRMDFQIKMHGYRIELGDIEKNLLLIPEIEQAIVLPKYDSGKIKHLVAFVKTPTLLGDFATSKYIKSQLKELLPSYMIPKQIRYLEEFPITNNGKIDRRRLEELIK